DARAGVEPDRVRFLEQRAEADLEAELVEVDVAALGDRVGECQVSMPVRRPAAEEAVAVLQPAAAGDRHVTVEGDEAALERERRAALACREDLGNVALQVEIDRGA